MKQTNYEVACAYVQDKRLSKRSLTIGNDLYEIFCYSKSTFYDKDWDEVTTTHRGKIYKNGVAFNSPFDKIFNLNEHAQVQEQLIYDLMEEEDYVEVFDKANGHLLIISVDREADVNIVSTKGSLDGDFVELDRELVCSMGLDERIKACDFKHGTTLMFEVIADYDKHTLFDQQMQLYSHDGQNTLVLLAISHNGIDASYTDLNEIGQVMQVPVVKRYNLADLPPFFDDMFSHRDIEGYVFHFPSKGLRVKIKTDFYWKIRFLKEFSLENIFKAFSTGGLDKLRSKLPEEMTVLIERIKLLIGEWVDYEISQIPVKLLSASAKDFNLSKDISQTSKWCYNISSKEDMEEHIAKFKKSRDVFLESDFFKRWYDNESSSFEEHLQQFIDKYRQGDCL